MKKLILTTLLTILCVSGMQSKASPIVQAQLNSIQQIAAPTLLFGGHKEWSAKQSYHETLTDFCDYVTQHTGWWYFDVDTTRKSAIWSSLGLIVSFILLYIYFNSKKLQEKTIQGQQDNKLLKATGIAMLSLSIIALLVQNILSVVYLVIAGDIDFMEFAITPFWEFVGGLFGVGAAIAFILIINSLLSFILSETALPQKSDNAIFGFILPAIAYILIIIASFLDYFHVNILPFSLKVLGIGCLLLPVLTIILSIVYKGKVWVAAVYGIVCGVSLACLGIIIAFYFYTIAFLTLLIIIGVIVLIFFFGEGGIAWSALLGGGDHSGNQKPYFSPDNMENTYHKDADGNEVFRNKTDNKLFRQTLVGFQEIDKDDVVD